MRQRIENNLLITIDGDVNMTTAKKIVVYMKQGFYFLEKTPEVVDEKTLTIYISKEEAMKLRDGMLVKMQTAWTDEGGNDLATDPVQVSVGELLKVGGYDGE